MVSVQLRIRGTVQGVGYRYALRREARRLGAHGWVRNRADGSVEALVQGEKPAVEALIAWARSGPPAAHVTELEAVAAAPEEALTGGFELRPTV
jgi:acylphosphatase